MCELNFELGHVES